MALIKRGYKVTLYCQNSDIASGASGNQQGALYPLLNQQHNSLSQFFANAFLFSRNYVQKLQQSSPFAHDLSGLLQLYYDQSATNKLEKILQAQLPDQLVKYVCTTECNDIANLQIDTAALFYPLAGWLSPVQMVRAIFASAKQLGELTIHLNQQLHSFSHSPTGCKLHFMEQQREHDLLILACGFETLNFTQCRAIPLSAARGQVTHIATNNWLSNLQVPLCHEGYLTPQYGGKHCMGATFKRHIMDPSFALDEQRENKLKLQKCLPNSAWTETIDCDHQEAHIGIRSTTRDHFPYVGALADYEATKTLYEDAEKSLPAENAPFYENIFILTGLGSRGLCSAPLAAEILASQIEGSPLPLSKNILNAMQTNRQWVNYLQKGKKMKI
ncbi:FAD-dependent 5-carboxymethylaminomethyl-2-thiouridine(34) oxidoreductase MnmC [Psychromonas sp. MME2]|uniref:FAD-dependent 5-carboxymethylaminomethyl-2-thiouridine(34) oxidoreductase MnmC n=1 Tax=Psychromonas sp. MME2 TaxID=3231033 RepID=UPI00339CA62F